VNASAGRVLLVGLLVSAAFLAASSSATAAAPCRPTLSAGGGPFESNAVVPPLRSRIGRGHVLTGRILRAPDCAPLRGATVEFWQASANGRYDRRGRARVMTGRNGTFRFEGPIPGSEFGRRPHIHIHVSAPGYGDFVTTYFVSPGQRRGQIRIVLVSDL
jgi:protocatechuate 3,4-dioxygenase beta subunit